MVKSEAKRVVVMNQMDEAIACRDHVESKKMQILYVRNNRVM